jgi:hypothetical protein
MENLSSTVLDDKEAIQNAKPQRRHSEEVHGRDDFAVITKETRPALARVAGRRQPPEIAGNSALGDIHAKFEKLPVHPRSAPGRVFGYHPPDEISNVGIDFGPAKAFRARSEAPEQPEPSPMPGDDGFWPDDDQDAAP